MKGIPLQKGEKAQRSHVGECTRLMTGTPEVQDDVRAPLGEFARLNWLDGGYVATVQEGLRGHEQLNKIQEMTRLLKGLSEEGEQLGGSPESENFDWTAVYEVASQVIDEYTERADKIWGQLDNLNRRVCLWQDSAFQMDTHRGFLDVNRAEKWMDLKERYLGQKRRLLTQSVDEIKSTVAKLPTT
ncbi:Gmc2p KNAG_0B06630 [Huiozyma naganishii CBS 8797]|uniref:Uncharacterized protein n=1 Tax=Huiozyma naganishii (strain ATCC MYA-139 / BCRC 22969 / CBS 8797 / KCTC 17520 / NBRC 10181 / NCYC 3082 / Yp74L-3) TaxID=1071383 RepID=J7S452_HUIN7|nr:hypothetical protein KNAG_0B06630 [Kazachstania naganishii CBS 8797]CCK69089.1 hypothetical protein KNAG_0B06630 [Kazachstania naganishii CBS 8797]